MNTIKLTPEPLTPENFSQFGDVISIEDRAFITINDGYANKYADLAKIDTQEENGETSVHIFVAKKRELPLHISMLEKHPFFSQTFIPKGNIPFIVVVSPPSEEPVIENIRVFISNGDQGISYSRGVWHFPLISTQDNAQFVVIDRKHNVDLDTINQCTVSKIKDVNVSLELSL